MRSCSHHEAPHRHRSVARRLSAARANDAGAPLTYLDSAATTQKPTAVLDAIRNYYVHDNANVHRAAHALADRATHGIRRRAGKAQAFVGATHLHEIVWTRGTTESINLVAHSYGGSVLRRGDEILISVMEHHSNIVPWQLVAQRTGATRARDRRERPRRTRSRRLRAQVDRPHEDRRDRPRLERARHHQPGQTDDRGRACRRRRSC